MHLRVLNTAATFSELGFVKITFLRRMAHSKDRPAGNGAGGKRKGKNKTQWIWGKEVEGGLDSWNG